MKIPSKHKTLMLVILSVLFVIILAFSLVNLLIKSTDKPEEEVVIDLGPQIDYTKIEKDGDKYHYEDEHFSSMFGIDVSTFQDKIDWTKVAADGVEFAYIRIGRRGATTGLLYEDNRFEPNYKGATDNNLKVGIYFFSQAKDEKEAVEEADFVLKLLNGRKIDLPIVYDCEEVFLEEGETPRLEGIGKKQLTDNALAFLEHMKKNGYDGMVYTYLYWAENFYEMDRITEKYPIWFAQYETDEPSLEYPFTIWQYSHTGTIDGISEPADLNIMFIPKDE